MTIRIVILFIGSLCALVASGFAQGAEADDLGTEKPAMSKDYHWYKGNLHMHSFWSDGGDFPEMIADWFKSHGYHFIAFTEHRMHQTGNHWIPTDPGQWQGQQMAEGDLLRTYVERFGKDWVEMVDNGDGERVHVKRLREYRDLVEEAGRFLIMNGEETDVAWSGPSHYVNVINAAQVVGAHQSQRSSLEAMQTLIDAASATSAESGSKVLVYLNHPNYLWNACAEDIAAVEGLRFMEIHTALDVTYPYGDATHAGAERIWDIVLSMRLSTPGGEVLYGLATDDSHVYHPNATRGDHEGTSSHPGRAWVMVRSESLTPEAIVGAMMRGDFYCSTGVTLRSLVCDGDGIRLSIEPEEGVQYTTRFIGTRRGADLSSTPVLDEAGKPVRTTRVYSEEVGKVLKEARGMEASYEFSGDELYVRAAVLSDKQHPKPTVPGDVIKAWTQPTVAAGR